MASRYLDMNTLRFLLHDVHQVEDILAFEHYADYDKSSVDILLDSIKDFADKVLFPVFHETDQQAAHYKDGKIIVHPIVEKVMRQGGELGLISSLFKYEDGGMQMPMMVSQCGGFILDAANNHLPGYLGLTSGAAELIVEFGSETLKEQYVPRMLNGDWGGTMCLTEPQAGSSLSDITTSATVAEDGSHYKIKGQKIFISGGDHEYCDNFIHLVLARIDGAPKGTKGISLFVVPKNRLNGESNDVITAGDFQKMGQKGYCTTHLMLGESNDCEGYLVGEPNMGLRYMFLMMNGARIAVGRGAAAITTAAYYASLEYANERPQGRKLNKSGDKNVHQEQTLIINHPDVRRMLLLQKAVSEGALSLVLLTSKYHDLSHQTTDPEEKANYHLLLELMTPLCKTYPSEMGIDAVNAGLQILGGYGFTEEYILQQYLRDIRIFSIYEGTTGIQSQDLLGRKVTTHGGKALLLLAQEVQKSVANASKFEEFKPQIDQLMSQLAEVQSVMSSLTKYANEGDFEAFLADATLFMEFFSKIVIAWLWLDMATNAKSALADGNTMYTESFYESKIHTMKFYFKYELTRCTSIAQILKQDDKLTVLDGKELIC